MRRIDFFLGFAFVLLSASAQGQDRYDIVALPSLPTSDSAVAIYLSRPSGCPITIADYYTHTVAGDLITIMHVWPRGQAIGLFGGCSEEHVIGKLAPGTYRVEWYEGLVGQSIELRSNPSVVTVARAASATTQPANPVPVGGPFSFALLITCIFLAAAATFRFRRVAVSPNWWSSRSRAR